MIKRFNLLLLKILTKRKYRVKIIKWVDGDEKYFPQYRYCFFWLCYRGGFPRSNISFYSKSRAWEYLREIKEEYEDRIKHNLILVVRNEYEE